jgi:4-hydroxy-tetrahydrodipicolinate synthase
MLALGAKGVISVLANVVPGDVARMIESFGGGDAENSRELHFRLFPIARALFLETNPMPVKRAMELMGMAAGEPRLPLVRLGHDAEVELTRILREKGLLE